MASATIQRVHIPLGMQGSYFYPITAKPTGAHPTYGAPLDMGAAVKGYLSFTSLSGGVYGDDMEQLHFDNFVSAQLDAETTCSDLSNNAVVFGHTYAEGKETSNINDTPPDGGYGFVEPILRKDKTLIYRATFLYLVSARLDSEKTEADTRKGDFNPKNNAVSYNVNADETGDWRDRQEFDTYAKAKAFLDTCAGQNQAA